MPVEMHITTPEYRKGREDGMREIIDMLLEDATEADTAYKRSGFEFWRQTRNVLQCSALEIERAISKTKGEA